MIFFIRRIYALLGVCNIIEQEIYDNVEAHHISYIEVAYDSQGKENYENFIFAEFDELFNSVGYNWKPYECIYPHIVMLLNDGISREGIENRKTDYSCFVFEFIGLVEIKTESETAQTCLKQEENEQCMSHHISGEKCNDGCKRTCYIV